MIKNRIFSLLGASLMFLAGCTVPDAALETDDVLVATFSAQNTRVSIQPDRSVLWTANDRFRAFSVDGAQYSTFTLQGEGGVAQGQFVRTSGPSVACTTAFFPLAADTDTEPSIVKGKAVFRLKKVYKKNENSHNAPMLGTVSNGRVAFRHLASILKLDLTGVDDAYNKVEIVADRLICGKYNFELNREGAVMYPTVSDSKYKSVTVERKSSEDVYYIPLPPQQYQFIKIYVLDAQDHRILKINLADKTLQQGYIYTANLGSSQPLLTSVQERANPQEAIASPEQIIDNQWVAVGLKKDYAIQRDSLLVYQGEPSYRFELQDAADNTLGRGRGRAELCYSYATQADFDSQPQVSYADKQELKTVYLYGKGHCPQGARMRYSFAFRLPSDARSDMHTIFAQWHGMPKRNLVYNAVEDKEQMLTDEEFIALGQRMYFDQDKGYDNATRKPNGWLCEQGGYPPMAFGFSRGYFYIQANSDKKWLSYKSESCNINPETSDPGDVKYSKEGNKSSTLAYELPFADFPKDTWVTFDIEVLWSTYVYGANEIDRPGQLRVTMKYVSQGQPVEQEIVNMPKVDIGRNDDDGYYFKYGIYRTNYSEVPVAYHLAGYAEQELSR